MHTHYFLQLQHCNATKNKLQHEAYEYFKSLDGLLIEKEQLPQLKKRIEDEIEKLNRCITEQRELIDMLHKKYKVPVSK